jgi:hypothetical protein
MARALECPACGEKHRIDNLPGTPTFRCERCGQILKMPEPVNRGNGSASAGPTRTTPVVPPPRRPGAGVGAPPRSPDQREVVGVSATVAAAGTSDLATDDRDADRQSRGDRRRARSRRAAPSTSAELAPTKVRWYWRLVAWVVAVPLGFVLTAWPAYRLGLIRKDDVLNIFVGSGLGRYARLAIETAVWALVTALLVQLFVDGGRRLVQRRKAKRAKAVAA